MMVSWSLTDVERVAATQQAIAQLEQSLAGAVDAARDNGVTWEQVAAALGVARQSAWRRFRKDSRMLKRQKRCSFCGATQRRVRHLVLAPTGACICGECLEFAQEMVNNAPSNG